MKVSYALVLLEDVCEAIIGGREQTGIPKVYADIEEVRLHQTRWHSSASSHGNKFIEIALDNPEEIFGRERHKLKKIRELII